MHSHERMKTEVEIECRFLVRKLTPGALARHQRNIIVQGYLGRDLRVRMKSSSWTWGIDCTLTRKTGKGLMRTETTARLDRDVAQMLLQGAKYQVQKSRYYKDGWEIDIYHGKLEGLIIAEREMFTPDEAVVLPSWIEDAVEVTDTLTNYQLAKLAHFLEDGDAVEEPLRRLIHRGPPRIAITGTPCSGKSTAIAQLKHEMPDLHCVPEAATIVMGQVGITPGIGTVPFQSTLRKVQASFEEGAARQAAMDGKRAIILDRGTLDGASFVGLENFEKMLRTTRDREYARYDAVIHLAAPSREVYEANKRNNPARIDAPYAEILANDVALSDIWSSHPGYQRIVDRPTWEEKFDGIKTALAEIMMAHDSQEDGA